MMQLTINLSDRFEILRAIDVLTMVAGIEHNPVYAETPAPAAAPVLVPAPASAAVAPQAPEPKAKKENVFKAPVKSEAEPVKVPTQHPAPPAQADKIREAATVDLPPVMDGVTIPDIQAIIKEHLKQFAAGSKDLMDERNNLIEILRETANVGSSADIPDDRLADTFIAMTQYINNRGDE